MSLSCHKADLRYLNSESANALSSLVIAGRDLLVELHHIAFYIKTTVGTTILCVITHKAAIS